MDTVDYQLLFKDCHAILGREPEEFSLYGIGDSQPYFTTLESALASPAAQNGPPFRLGILPGVYREKVSIRQARIELIGPPLDPKGNPQACLVWGDCAGFHSPDGTALGTFRSQSLAILAPDFRARNLHFANDWDYPGNEAIPQGDPRKINGSQAVAVKLDEGADRSIFQNCHFSGYQDTLYANAGRHLFLNCSIQGHVDYIFGAAQVLFDSCRLICLGRPGLSDSTDFHGYVCAPSTKPDKSCGFVFLACSVMKGEPTPPPASFALGRPWHPSHSPDTSNCALFHGCWMDDHIRPQAWTSMNSRPGGVLTTYYPEDAQLLEFASKGPGAVQNASPGRKFLEEGFSREALYKLVFEDWETGH